MLFSDWAKPRYYTSFMYVTMYLVTLAKRLRYGDDGQVFRVLVKDDLVAVYFQYAGQEYAVARTDKQGLAWNEAKERCQLLGGDLPILRKITAEGYEILETEACKFYLISPISSISSY